MPLKKLRNQTKNEGDYSYKDNIQIKLFFYPNY